MNIEIIPAMDLIDGACVRLAQGDYDRRTTFGRGADVEVDQLVGTFGGVAGAQLHRIAHTAQVGEIDALDRPAVADVQAGDYSFGKHRPRSSGVIRPS